MLFQSWGIYCRSGDRITVAAQGGNVQYVISSVEDVKDIEDTFYIFDIDELQERITGQQDGVYYLTCVRGNYHHPTRSAIGNNRNYNSSTNF